MRDYLDTTGYGSTAADERLGFLAGALMGAFLIGCCFLGAAL